MKINNEEVAFNLSETLVANELDRYNLKIQYMSLGVDNNPLVLSMNDINVNLISSINKDTWTSINYDLSTLKDDTTDYITTFNLKLNEGNGYIDDIRIVEKDNYPADGEDVVVPTENTIYLTYPTDDVEVPILYEPVRQYYFDFKESRKDVEDDYLKVVNFSTNHLLEMDLLKKKLVKIQYCDDKFYDDLVAYLNDIYEKDRVDDLMKFIIDFER